MARDWRRGSEAGYYMTRDDIMDLLGANNWQQVAEEFTHLRFDEIKESLDKIFPDDDNSELAQAIALEV